jgi:very-short-patch-repair endonuclease
VAAEEWRRVGRGVYVPVDGPPDKRADALARIIGFHARLSAATCFSHTSAAVLHGLPLWEASAETHVFQRSSASGDRSPEIVRHTPFPLPDDLVLLDGIPATTLGRTAWDCARYLRPLGGLVIVDAALRAGAHRADLEARAAAAAGRRGSARGIAVLRLADGGAESAWESACRFTLLRAGLPVPQTQVPVETRLGTFWADLGWEEWKVALEYDGRTKYVGRTTEEFMREKRRHDAVVEEGWRMLRITRDDVRQSGALVRRVAALLPPAATTSLRPRRELG